MRALRCMMIELLLLMMMMMVAILEVLLKTGFW